MRLSTSWKCFWPIRMCSSGCTSCRPRVSWRAETRWSIVYTPVGFAFFEHTFLLPLTSPLCAGYQLSPVCSDVRFVDLFVGQVLHAKIDRTIRFQLFELIKEINCYYPTLMFANPRKNISVRDPKKILKR